MAYSKWCGPLEVVVLSSMQRYTWMPKCIRISYRQLYQSLSWLNNDSHCSWLVISKLRTKLSHRRPRSIHHSALLSSARFWSQSSLTEFGSHVWRYIDLKLDDRGIVGSVQAATTSSTFTALSDSATSLDNWKRPALTRAQRPVPAMFCNSWPWPSTFWPQK